MFIFCMSDHGRVVMIPHSFTVFLSGKENPYKVIKNGFAKPSIETPQKVHQLYVQQVSEQ